MNCPREVLQEMKTGPYRAALIVLFFQLTVSLAVAEEKSAEIIAVQVRDQGYACDKALSAESDPKFSKPGEDAWLLKCDNATYRVFEDAFRGV